jgi:heptosyltransferase-1
MVGQKTPPADSLVAEKAEGLAEAHQMTHQTPDSTPQRILIVKPSSLGDVVTAMPVLRGLRRTFPNAAISWLISNTCSALVQHDTDLDEVILFERKKLGHFLWSAKSFQALRHLIRDLRHARFDWAIDLQGLFRSGFLTAATGAHMRAGFADARELAGMFYNRKIMPHRPHTVDRNLELVRELGVDAHGSDMTLQVQPEARSWAEKFLADLGLHGKDYVICVPPCRWSSKQYPIRHWRSVVAELARRLPVVLIGSPSKDEMQLCAAVTEGMGQAVINSAGQTDVAQMVALIAQARGVICCDSSAKFIAPAVGVGAVTVIGPTRVELTGPYPAGSAIVADVPCQGCLRRRCNHNACMETIQPAQVLTAAWKMTETA